MNARLAKAAFAALLTSALTSACLPQATNEPGEDDGSVTLASFISQQNYLSNRNLCRKVFECTDDVSDAALIFGRYGSIDECVRGDAFGALTQGALDLGALTRAGFEIDEESARTCLDQMQAQTTRHACSIELTPQACTEALVGPGEEGDACEGDYHCGSGLVCEASYYDMCGGTCVAEESYDDEEYLEWCGDSECAAGEYCAWETDTCVPRLEEGDACEPSGIDACSESSYDLRCLPREDGTGTARCVADQSLDAGEYCGDDAYLCAGNMGCVEGRCAYPEPTPLMAAPLLAV